MTKPSDPSMKRAHEELERWYASGKGYYHPEALAALLDAVRDEALEEAVRAVYDVRHAEDLTRAEAAKRIRALKVKR